MDRIDYVNGQLVEMKLKVAVIFTTFDLKESQRLLK